MFNIVLVEPEIPQNTGNIARTCAVTGCMLHIVLPMSFEIDDKKLKRAGLDYWDKLGVKYYENYNELKDLNPDADFYLATTKAKKCYSEAKFKKGDFLVFGKETAGLSKEILDNNPQGMIRIPMLPNLRSLNLSNSVAIMVYEALRQNSFFNML